MTAVWTAVILDGDRPRHNSTGLFSRTSAVCHRPGSSSRWIPVGVSAAESARFLIVRGDAASAAKILGRREIRPDNADPAEAEPESTRLPLTDLFRHGYCPGTLLLWAAMFLTLVMTYFLVAWLPTVAVLAGAHIGLLAVSTLNLGGIVGCLLIGRLADRRTPAIVLGAAYTLGAIAIALIGWAAKDNVRPQQSRSKRHRKSRPESTR
jgi:hypothetical protein